MRPYFRKDKNHNTIAKTFSNAGFSVFDTSQVGYGFPDMVIAKRGVSALIEVKSTYGVLTPNQVKFISNWQGEVYVIRSVDEASNLIALWLQKEKVHLKGRLGR